MMKVSLFIITKFLSSDFQARNIVLDFLYSFLYMFQYVYIFFFSFIYLGLNYSFYSYPISCDSISRVFSLGADTDLPPSFQ